MHTNHLLHTLQAATIIILLTISGITHAANPRLTVVVSVDGLTEENLARLRPYWSMGGLRTLSEEAYQTTVAYPHPVYGGAETTATLMTGTCPIEHGYAMDHYFLRSDRKTHTLLEDTKEKGIGTSEKLSARALLGSTLTDKWRMRYGEKARIYAIGLHPQTTIVMAGHAANACCWLDGESRHWVATSYYSEGLPSAADDMNMSGRINELAGRTWTPRIDVPMYTSPTAEERKKGFSYEQTKVLLHSPAANTLVIELALAMQKKEKLGEDTTPDILLLELNTLSPKATSDQIHSAEHEDMYLWLNQDLGYLMEQLNKRIGAQNYELLVVGRPIRGEAIETMRAAGLESHQFNVDRTSALIATYLMAIYGHERWVDGGYGQTIFLNRTLIEQKRLSLETIQRQVANFLMEFEGVALAYPVHEAMLNNTLLPGLSKRTMGDVIFCLEPDWQLMANDKQTIDYVINSDPKSPLLLWSGAIRQWPQGQLRATDIATLIGF